MLVEPIEVFRSHIEKAELMVVLLGVLEEIELTGKEMSADMDQTIEEMGDDSPLIAGLMYAVKCTLELKTQEPRQKFDLFKRTVREYTIVPAITATETYFKLIYELQQENECKRTIGSLKTINEIINEINTYDILNDSEAKLAERGFAFRHAIIHNLGKMDKKACDTIGISRTHAGKDISPYLKPDTATEIIDCLKKLVEESNKILTSEEII